MLMLVVVPFTLFVQSYMESEDKYFCNIVCGISVVNLVINTTCHMLNIWYFKKMVLLIHFCIALALIYLIYTVIERWKRHGFDQKVKLNLIGAAILVLSVLVDTMAYYFKFRQTDIIGRIGLLIYIALLGTHTTLDFFAKVQEGRKVEIYKEMAKKDGMTGLYNRNAFDEWEYNFKEGSNTLLIICDLNNLKRCNDTKGHEMGDKYLIDAATLILKVFDKVGKCYRIGGDEFCVVIERAEKFKVEEYLEQLKKEQEIYNSVSTDIDMQIACGYAIHDKADITIEETRSRADARMYVHKKEIKSKNA